MTQRFAILGHTHSDAHQISRGPLFRDSLDHPVLIGTESHLLNIEGSVAGMHIATVYVGPLAHRGANYEAARAALQRCLAKTGGTFRQVDARGIQVVD
jgi:hypothetical protein